jgi:hypothetical protein
MPERMRYVEITWAYDQEINPSPPGPDRISRPVFFPLAIIAGEEDKEQYTAQELFARGYHLIAVLPRWDGRIYGTSIWEAPDA